MTPLHPPPFDILLVEDDPGDAGLTKVALRQGKVHCRVHHVIDGVDAMAFLRRERPKYTEAPRPDLVLLDLNMPRMGGREVLKEIRSDESLKDIPVVVLTTSDVERDVENSYRLGANSYVTKPMDMDQFVAAVLAIEDYWFGLVRLPK